jgi:antibiotic biosynthesis monooxygenase (ABM) superfamily enzyme
METTGAPIEPVTIVVSRDVVPGHEAEYQAWMRRMIELARRFPGNLGATVLVPDAPPSNRRIVIHRWADEPSMHAWEASEERHRLLMEAEEFSTFQSQRATGLETWFSLRDLGLVRPPPRWKMFVVTLMGAYAVGLLLALTLVPRLSDVPLLIRQAAISVAFTGLLTFVVMPRLTRLLRRWLYASSGRSCG